MVNPQSADIAFVNQIEQQRVDGLKHLGIFHADRGELIDVKNRR